MPTILDSTLQEIHGGRSGILMEGSQTAGTLSAYIVGGSGSAVLLDIHPGILQPIAGKGPI